MIPSNRPFRIYLAQANLESDVAYCATCIMLYKGLVSLDEGLQDHIRKSVQAAIDDGKDSITFTLPNPVFYHMYIYEAITTGPSWEVPSLTNHPVCFTHIKGAAPSLLPESPMGPVALDVPPARRTRNIT